MKQVKARLSALVATIVAISFIFMGGQTFADTPMQGEITAKELNEQLVMATLWMQTSAEYRALCYQTFNMAREALIGFLAVYNGKKPAAIIVDADETVIDNSAYQAFLIGQGFGYSSKTWNPWMAAAEAKAIPGAVEFLNFAKSKGVEVFYITNRKMVGYEGTMKNLKALNFPYVDKKHLLLRTKSSDKQARRNSVMRKYALAFMMGDNLNDFESVFAKKTVEQRFAETDNLKDRWGIEYIVLPNPTYGDWYAAVIDGKFGATPAEKDKMGKAALKRWNYTP